MNGNRILKHFVFYTVLGFVQSKVCYYWYYVTDTITHYAGVYCFYGCCFKNKFICCEPSTTIPSTTEYHTTLSTSTYSSSTSIVGIVLGSTLGILFCIVTFACICYQKRKKASQPGDRNSCQYLASYITTSNTSSIRVYCIQNENPIEQSRMISTQMGNHCTETTQSFEPDPPPSYDFEPPPPYTSVITNGDWQSLTNQPSTESVSRSVVHTTV